ncbi:MAG: UDP-N-acetylmuramate dehydrogenase [Thermoleophilia bacterium]|nr:UDP-N-acetylmuramate dehydrogenase [Thermoleophilia bacterium]
MALSSAVIQALRAVQGSRLWVDAPMAPFTTIGTGGKAAVLVTVVDTLALVATLKILDHGIPWFCLGAGTDLLVADEGYPGVVVKLDDSFHYVEGMPAGPGCGEERVTVTVGAGTLLPKLAAVAGEAGLAGLEFACGIPGSVGGALATNAGAYGSSMAEVVQEVEVATTAGSSWIRAADLTWSYRRCHLAAGAVVTAVRFALTSGDPAEILKRHRSILQQRRRSHPQGVRTFGCAFMNPSGGGAGRFIDAAGLKGVRRGGAEISRVHANFLVNLGNATTADVLALMNLMRQEVERANDVLLEPEVRLLGTRFPWEAPSAPQGPPDTHG